MVKEIFIFLKDLSNQSEVLWGIITVFLIIILHTSRLNRILVKRKTIDNKIIENNINEKIAELNKTLAQLQKEILSEKIIKDRIETLAFYDNLTHLPNRYLLTEQYNMMVSRAERAETKVAVLFLDLDKFKDINDTYGHSVGDILLKQIAHRLIGCIRKSDIVSRYGGDEFVILIPDISDVEIVKSIAEKILLSIKEPFNINNNIIFSSFSIGITIYPDNGLDFDTLSNNADLSMYTVKNNGGNSYKIFTL